MNGVNLGSTIDLPLSSDGTKYTFVPPTGVYTRIGDAGTTSHTLASNNDLFVSGKFECDGVGYCDSTLTVAGVFTAPNIEMIADGTLTAGNANAFAFAWQNPHAYKVLVTEVLVNVTTAGGTALSVLDVGSAANATTTGSDLINDADLNAIALYSNTGMAIVDEKDGTTDYVTGQILTANAASLVGKYYIKYRPV
jgi:hypothetical protein